MIKCDIFFSLSFIEILEIGRQFITKECLPFLKIGDIIYTYSLPDIRKLAVVFWAEVIILTKKINSFLRYKKICPILMTYSKEKLLEVKESQTYKEILKQ